MLLKVEVLKNYARSEIAGSEINAFPPKLKLALPLPLDIVEESVLESRPAWSLTLCNAVGPSHAGPPRVNPRRGWKEGTAKLPHPGARSTRLTAYNLPSKRW